MKYDNIIEILKKNAYNSQMKNKHASCLLKNGNIYSFGVNKYYNTKQITLSIHAEIDALACIKKTIGMDMIVIRLDKNNMLKMSKPCIHCIDKMVKCGINKVYYSNEYGNIICEYTSNIINDHVSSGFKYKESFKK